MIVAYKTINTEIEIDLNDLDIDDIVDELENEGYIVLGKGSGKELLYDWAELYKANRHSELLEKIRTLIQNHTGKVLP